MDRPDPSVVAPTSAWREMLSGLPLAIDGLSRENPSPPPPDLRPPGGWNCLKSQKNAAYFGYLPYHR
jgi:hypothetical protein